MTEAGCNAHGRRKFRDAEHKGLFLTTGTYTRPAEDEARRDGAPPIGELYGGAVETRMALDLQQVLAWIDGSDEEPTTVRDANFQSARLDTLRSRNSAAYKGIHVLLQRNGAKDWFWKSTIRDLDETDWEGNKLDIHHVFPKDWCKQNGIEAKRYDSILNKTPISYRANRMIGGKAPSKYLQQLQSDPSVQLVDGDMDALIETHCLEAAFLRADDYDGFVESRRKILMGHISTAIGKPIIETGEAVPEDEGDDEEGEN